VPGSDEHVDFELNKGIDSNFYQELVSVDASSQQINFLAPVQHKLVATPDLDSLFE